MHTDTPQSSVAAIPEQTKHFASLKPEVADEQVQGEHTDTLEHEDCESEVATALAAKKDAKVARRNAANVGRKAAKAAAVSNKTMCRYTGCLVEPGDDSDTYNDYHIYQASECMYLRRQLRVFKAWQTGKFPSWTDPCQKLAAS